MYQRQVTFSEAIDRALKQNYCNFTGRASRSEYWWFVLFNLILSFVVGVITAFVGQSVGQIISLIVSLALLLPGLGLAVRRLHDTGRSGWWVLLAFVPLANLLLIYWFCLDSQPMENEYGPVPNMTA